MTSFVQIHPTSPAGARRRPSPGRRLALVGVALALALAPGCARQVVRIAPEQAIDLSGRWNDVDSRLVAEALIQQSFEAGGGQSWAVRHAQRNGGARPTVIVGSLRNRTMEHVPVGTFVRDLERGYINTGLVNVVASDAEREELRGEREDQQQFAAASTRARLKQETGADYMLQGEIQSIEDRERGRSVVFYQVDVTLTDLESNSRVWVGQHKIKKFIDRPRLGL
jgi:penicillin-binding protein activator